MCYGWRKKHLNKRTDCSTLGSVKSCSPWVTTYRLNDCRTPVIPLNSTLNKLLYPTATTRFATILSSEGVSPFRMQCRGRHGLGGAQRGETLGHRHREPISSRELRSHIG